MNQQKYNVYPGQNREDDPSFKTYPTNEQTGSGVEELTQLLSGNAGARAGESAYEQPVPGAHDAGQIGLQGADVEAPNRIDDILNGPHGQQ